MRSIIEKLATVHLVVTLERKESDQSLRLDMKIRKYKRLFLLSLVFTVPVVIVSMVLMYIERTFVHLCVLFLCIFSLFVSLLHCVSFCLGCLWLIVACACVAPLLSRFICLIYCVLIALKPYLEYMVAPGLSVDALITGTLTAPVQVCLSVCTILFYSVLFCSVISFYVSRLSFLCALLFCALL